MRNWHGKISLKQQPGPLWLTAINMSNEPTQIPTPVRLEKTKDRHLLIQWSDDVEQQISFRRLRDNCCCANCIDKRMESLKEKPSEENELGNPLPVLSLAETLPLDIVSMHPVGNYAYNILFSDGHSAGIFTFELLRGLNGDIVQPDRDRGNDR